MTAAFVGLGANLDGPDTQILDAIRRLRGQPGMAIQAVSSLYRSAPLGQAGQPDYCNAVVMLETTLTAQATLDCLLGIERAMGRKRTGERWAPRRIDLDLLLFGAAVIDEPGLHVPHPEMHKRNFVMIPLTEIAPDARLPGQGTAAQIARDLGDAGLGLWERRAW